MNGTTRWTIGMAMLVPLLGFTILQPAGPEPASADTDATRLEISISERLLFEYVDDEVANIYPVAVGKTGHETPEGTFRIHRIDWNPDFTPPDSEWAEEYDYMEPGDPDNPMGRVRMVYQAPYSIHGTDALHSLGEAASHGSVRMGNDDIIELARRVMEYGGESRSEEWYQRVLDDPTTMHQVELSNPVLLVNY
jgi:lipoprotein-anchoring transpeptidase ErfK/SrfK